MKETIAFILDGITDLYYSTKASLTSPVEPHSTWSNIFYAIGGLIIIFLFPTMWFYGVLLLILGFSSFLYHGTKNYRWQNFDEIMMYFTFVGLINGIMFLSGDISYVGFLLMTTVFGSLFAYYHEVLDSYIMMPFLFIVAWLLFLLNSGLLIYSMMYLVLFSLATLLNLVGRKYKDRSFIFYETTHSIWHYMTAYGLTDMMLKMDWSKVWAL